jgi:membrane-anchored glycerophosphoryl diester phosphodiesterase (GDPDase)
MGFILFVIPGVFLFLGWYICIPVMVVEKRGVLESLSRSWELTKGYKRWILLLTVILWVVTVVISTVLTLTSIPFGNPMTATLTGGTTIFWIVYAFSSAIAQTISVLINIAVVAAVYYEIRDLKEGITPESIASVFD